MWAHFVGQWMSNKNFLQRGWGKFSGRWFEYYQSRFSSTSWPLHKLWMKRRGADIFFLWGQCRFVWQVRLLSELLISRISISKTRRPPGFRKMASILIGSSRLARKKCSKTCRNSAILCTFCVCVCLMHHVCQLTAHYLCMTSGGLNGRLTSPFGTDSLPEPFVGASFLFALEQRIEQRLGNVREFGWIGGRKWVAAVCSAGTGRKVRYTRTGSWQITFGSITWQSNMKLVPGEHFNKFFFFLLAKF